MHTVIEEPVWGCTLVHVFPEGAERPFVTVRFEKEFSRTGIEDMPPRIQAKISAQFPFTVETATQLVQALEEGIRIARDENPYDKDQASVDRPQPATTVRPSQEGADLLQDAAPG